MLVIKTVNDGKAYWRHLELFEEHPGGVYVFMLELRRKDKGAQTASSDIRRTLTQGTHAVRLDANLPIRSGMA